MTAEWFDIRHAISEERFDDVVGALTGRSRIPQDIAYVLASRCDAHPEFRQILLTLDEVQDCVINRINPARTGRWNSMSVLRHLAAPFADWNDRPADAIRSSLATRRQKRACGTRESTVFDKRRAGEPVPEDTVAEVWERILREEDFLNVERSQFYEWHYEDVIRRFPEKIRRGAAEPSLPGLAKEAARIICGWGDAELRAKLALNPELPLDLLVRLIDDPAEPVARACAHNAQCIGDLANRLESRFPDLGEALDEHPRADIDRQLRVPLRRLSGAGLRWFLRATMAGDTEAEAVRTAIDAAGTSSGGGAEASADASLGAVWLEIGWRTAETRLPLS